MLKKENLSDRLADIIGKQIIQNELKSGEIIYETQIAKEWGVSRSPVRDAMRILEQKRLVERTTKGSYRVTEMSANFIQNLYETVDLLYQYAFAKTARTATKENLLGLESALAKIEKSAEIRNIELYLQGILEFAQIILKAAGNPIVESMAMELMPNAERVQWMSLTCLPNNYEKAARHLRSSLKSIKEKKSQGAAKAFIALAAVHVEAASQYFEDEKIESSRNK